MDAVNYESITVGATAVGLTSAIVTPDAPSPTPLEAYISVEDAGGAGMRYRIDGTSPTAAEGHLLQDEDSISIMGRGDLSRFRAIRAGAASVTIRVTYFA